MGWAEKGTNLGCACRVEDGVSESGSPWEHSAMRLRVESQPLWSMWPQHRGRWVGWGLKVLGSDLKVRGSGWDGAFGPSETHSILLPVVFWSDLLGRAGHTLPS